jgi:hypothetical protein
MSREQLQRIELFTIATAPTLVAPNMVKVKVKLSLCFNLAPRHEGVLGEWKYSSIHSSTSALDGGEWLASHPGHFTARERALGIQWIGGWVGPRAVLDAVLKRKVPSPLPGIEP